VDGLDQAQVEDGESYLFLMYDADIMLREWTVAQNSLRISVVELANIGLLQNASPMFHLRQIGRFAQSRPLTFGLVDRPASLISLYKEKLCQILKLDGTICRFWLCRRRKGNYA